MTLDEFKDRLLTEKLIVINSGLPIWYGKHESPCILGIYEENGVWYVYHTDDRGEIVVLTEGSENDMMAALYRRVLKREKLFNRKLNNR